MVKFHKAQTTYPHPFPAVSLAYFLRYPNPYSTHVLSTDTISRHLDPVTGRLHTVRLHLKQSRVPTAIAKILPKGILSNGQSSDGQARNFILETTVVDPREGWMETETRNLQYTGVLTVIEQQRYSRPGGPVEAPIGVAAAAASTSSTDGGIGDVSSFPSSAPQPQNLDLLPLTRGESTNCATTITYVSRFGQSARAPRSAEEEPRRGFFATWSTAALQRAIETSGVQRTHTAMRNGKEGMLVVLERIRKGGLVEALEGMRRDRELVLAGVGGDANVQKTWRGAKEARDRPDSE